MDLHSFLLESRQEIIAEAAASLKRAHLEHYEKAGAGQLCQRLDNLLSLTLAAVAERNLAPMVAHANAVAQERFDGGFDLSEVQTAFNVLEEAVWLRILKRLPSPEQAEALGLVSTVLGAGKDALARKYVSLATQARVPSLNLQALFSGTDGR
ncbi:MAG: hypothetical protein IPQ13_00160 [Holophagaceae bacterium]|nr:hypothetical protein [Holophagaceae bacterium]